MYPFHLMKEYTHYRILAEQALNKMQTKIATAKSNLNIPLAKHEENERAYNVLKTFMIVSENTINKLGNEHFKEGYEKGRKDEKELSAGGIPNKYYEKEAYRAFHEVQVKSIWSDLY
jgi:hypothetical protein